MISKKQGIHVGILTIVFLLAVAIFSYVTNKENNNLTADMGAATYPQVSFSYNGYALNSLPGYAKEMDIPVIRDTITPVVNGQISVQIKANENAISSMEYTVYTLDGEEDLYSDTVKKPGETVDLELSEEGLLDEERVMQVTLHVDEDKEIYFYTRIRDAANCNTLELLDYVSAFHENAMGKVENVGVGAAIEPSSEGDNSTFQHVTIHSDYDHVSWGDLQPQVEGGERWSITEMNQTYTSICLEYRVVCQEEEEDTTATYAVKEFFRVRHVSSNKVTYLLDYDRTMDQIFDASKEVLSEKGVLLGIADPNIPYLVNEDGTIVSFVQANEMWNYNRNTDEVSLVFSFANAEGTDVRNLRSQHVVKLLEMDEEGNTTFAVYGYMNRGAHEGEVGVVIYQYDIEENAVYEKIFISTNQSYGNAEYELGKLVYYSTSQDMLYVLVDGTLYEINAENGRRNVLVEGLEESQYVVSDDGQMAAYVSSEEEDAGALIVKDFASGDERQIECPDEEVLVPLGFVERDFVYGTAKASDVGQTISGATATAMYKVDIQNSKAEIIKTYEQSGIYILSAQFDTKMITLKRATKEGDVYTTTTEDYITNNEPAEESNIYAETYTTELKGRQVRITYDDGISDQTPKLLKPKQVLSSSGTTISFDDVQAADKYYVYGYGALQGIYDEAGEAIIEANRFNGVVVSAWQSYVWERSNRDTSHTVQDDAGTVDQICTRLNAGEKPVEIMDSLSDGKVMDLTGCDTEELLYILNQDTPIIAMINVQQAVVLVGYTDETVTFRDAITGEQQTVSYEDMDNMTTGSGHTYIGYMQ